MENNWTDVQIARQRAAALRRADAFYARRMARKGRLPRWLAVLIFVALLSVAAIALSSIARQRAANDLMLHQAICQQEIYYRAVEGLPFKECKE